MIAATAAEAGVDALWVCETFYTAGEEFSLGDPLCFRTVAPRDMRERAPRAREAPNLPNGMVLAPRPGRSEGGGGWYFGPKVDPTRLRELPGGVPGFSSFLALDEKVLLVGVYLQPSAPLAEIRRFLALPPGPWEATVVLGDLNVDLAAGDLAPHEAGRFAVVTELLLDERQLHPILPAEDMGPSYVGTTSTRWLDWVLTDLQDHGPAKSWSELHTASDHLLVTADICMPWTAESRTRIEPRRVIDLENLDAAKLEAALLAAEETPLPGEALLAGLCRQEAVDLAMDALVGTLLSAAEKVAGIKTVGGPPKRALFDPEVKSLLEQRRRYYNDVYLPRLRAGTVTPIERERWTRFRVDIARADKIARIRVWDRRVVAVDTPSNGRGFQVLMAIRRRCARTKPGIPATPAGVAALREHFAAMFAERPWQPVAPQIRLPHEDPLAAEDLARRCVTEDRLRGRLKVLPMAKAAGYSGLSNEILKASAKVGWVFERLLALFRACFAWGLTPSSWRRAVVCPVFKKGDASLAKNYRPISLTETPRKLYEAVIVLAIGEEGDLVSPLHPYQNGFRSRRSTADAIIALQETIISYDHRHDSEPPPPRPPGQRGRPRKPPKSRPILVFLDIRAAYDSVVRPLLWQGLLERGSSPILVAALQALFDHCWSNVRSGQAMSEVIEHKTGLLQGSSLSPLMYAHFLDGLLRQLEQQATWKLGDLPVAALAYADDLVLVAESREQAQRMLDVCSEFAAGHGFTFAPEKCEVLAEDPAIDLRLPELPGPRPADAADWPQVSLGHVERFVYLGASFSYMGMDPVTHARTRAAKAAQAVHTLVRMGCNGGGFGPRLTRQMYVQVVRPTLVYACHLVPLTGAALAILEKAQHMALTRLRSLPRCSSGMGMRFYLDVPTIAVHLAAKTAALALRLEPLAMELLPSEHVTLAAFEAWKAQNGKRRPARWAPVRQARGVVEPEAEVPIAVGDAPLAIEDLSSVAADSALPSEEDVLLDSLLGTLTIDEFIDHDPPPMDPAVPAPPPDERPLRRPRPPSKLLGARKGGASFFDAVAASPAHQIFAALDPVSPSPAAALDRALRAWTRAQQAAEVASNETSAVFAMLSGTPGCQMVSLHAVEDRHQRRAAERLLLAPWGGAEAVCGVCQAPVRLSAGHLETCGGVPFIAAVRSSEWATAGPAIVSALGRCRGDTVAVLLPTRRPMAQGPVVVVEPPPVAPDSLVSPPASPPSSPPLSALAALLALLFSLFWARPVRPWDCPTSRQS